METDHEFIRDKNSVPASAPGSAKMALIAICPADTSSLKSLVQTGQVCRPNGEPQYRFQVSGTCSLQWGQITNAPYA